MSLISILKKRTKNTLFTTPSHGGNFFIYHKFYQWYKSDISETETHNPQKALDCAEKNAARIYNTKFTKFPANELKCWGAAEGPPILFNPLQIKGYKVTETQ